MRLKKNLALSDSGFIFDPSTGDSFNTNPIGQDIIQLMKQGKNPDEIGKHIMQQYQVDEQTFEKDYYDFMSMLSKLKLTEGHEKEKS